MSISPLGILATGITYPAGGYIAGLATGFNPVVMATTMAVNCVADMTIQNCLPKPLQWPITFGITVACLQYSGLVFTPMAAVTLLVAYVVATILVLPILCVTGDFQRLWAAVADAEAQANNPPIQAQALPEGVA